MIRGETLQNENAFYCSTCEKSVRAQKTTFLQKLPNILIIALKRLEFNFETLQRTKINDRCEFPNNLNLARYCVQSFSDSQVHYSDDYYNYTLKGVVIHTGTADSGHYYSLIKKDDCQQTDWIEFNDTNVSIYDSKNFERDAFG